MADEYRDPSRIGRKRPRLSESDTRTRALRTAVDALLETGLSVGLDHISMEDVIREAGVSRTAVYRLWPQKDQFIGDLILVLAETAIPGVNTRGEEATKQISGFLLPRLNELVDPASRWQLVSEMVGAAASLDFQYTASLSTQWRTYFALVAAVMNLPNEELRAKAQSAMSAAERRYRERLGENYRIVASLLGFHLADPAQVDFEAVADLIIAMVRGFILHNEAFQSRSDLSLLRAGLEAILSRCFEIDPGVEWDDERLNYLRTALSSPPNLFARTDAPR